MPSPSFLLKQLKTVPKLSAMVDVMRADKEAGETTNWANWCFLPHEAWNAIAQAVEANPIRQSTLGDFLSAVGTWRYSQGIYRFDETFYQAVADSDGMSKIPSEVLLRLPEWSVYVETPNMTFMGAAIDGFFAHLDDDRMNGRTILRLSLVEHETPDPLSFVTFPISLATGVWMKRTTRLLKKPYKGSPTHRHPLWGRVRCHRFSPAQSWSRFRSSER